MHLTAHDVAAMRAAAMLFPGHMPAAPGTPDAALRPRPIPGEGLALIEELKLLALDHAALATGGEAPSFATDIEDATMLEQTARAMTTPCVAALGLLDADTPAWIASVLRTGAERLSRYARMTTAQRMTLMTLDPRMLGNGIELKD